MSPAGHGEIRSLQSYRILGFEEPSFTPDYEKSWSYLFVSPTELFPLLHYSFNYFYYYVRKLLLRCHAVLVIIRAASGHNRPDNPSVLIGYRHDSLTAPSACYHCP